MNKPATPTMPALRDAGGVFDGASFTAFLDGDLYIRTGKVVFRLAVPPEGAEEALKLRVVSGNTVPLDVTLRIAAGFLEGIEAETRALQGGMGQLAVTSG